MIAKPLALALILTLTSASLAQVVINEIDADQTGSDTADFIELFGAPNTSLDGLIVVLFNGNNDDDESYRTIDLNGFSTNSQGIFLIGSNGMVGADIVVAGNSWLQNGADAVAIYQDDASNFNNTPVTATNLIDAVVYGTDDFDDTDLLDVLTPDEAQLDESANGASDTESNQRVPDGGDAFDIGRYTQGVPSPGALNNPSAELNFFFSATSVAENAGADGTITATLSHDGDPDTPVIVTITNSDPSELAMPSEVTIPGDGSGETTFLITPLDDGAEDGTITVNILGTSLGFFDALGSIDVTDDGDVPSLIINEVNAEVEEGRDANQNGLTDHQGDEFIELINVSGGSLDISGWTISDNDGLSHLFPPGSVLDPGCALVVFGSGIPVEGILGAFGNAHVQNASTGALNLNNTGDAIFIRDLGALERAGFAFGDIDGMEGSQTRDPDLTGSFVGHLAASGLPFSPGTTTSGTPFCIVANALSISVTGAVTFSEAAGTDASMLVVSRTGDTGSLLEVAISVSDLSELSAPSTVTIPSGELSISFPIDAVDDAFVDDAQQVIIAATAGPDFVSASTEVTVEDDGADSNYILINEVEIDSPGSDTAEFIELYDGGVGNTRLDGYAVVLFNGGNGNGNDNISYDQFDLDGFSTNADGFFVIGTIGVPNAGIDVFPLGNGWIINSGTRAIALYSANAADHPNGTFPSGTRIVDAVIYGSDDEATDLVAAFGTPAEVLSIDSSSNTLSRLPDGAGGRLIFSGFGDGDPTPGTANSAEGGASPYQLWAADFPGIGAPGDDDESDTLANVIEFGLGLDPFQSDTAALPSPFINDGGNLQITVTKGPDVGTSTFFAEISFDGQSWSDTDLNIITDDATTFAAEYTGSEPTVLMRWGLNIDP